MVIYIKYIFVILLVVMANIGYVRLLFIKKQLKWLFYLPYALFLNAIGLGAVRRLLINREIYLDFSLSLLMFNVCFFITGYIIIRMLKKQNNIKHLQEWLDRADEGVLISKKIKMFTSLLYFASLLTYVVLAVLNTIN